VHRLSGSHDRGLRDHRVARRERPAGHGHPEIVRFTGVAGHFSTWAVVIATPIPVDSTPPVFSNVPAPIVAQATGPSGAKVIYTPPSATDDVSGAVSVTC